MSFQTLEAANRRRSIILVVIVFGVLIGLGLLIGYAYSGSATSGLLYAAGAAGFASISTLLAYRFGDKLVLSSVGAYRAEGPKFSQLHNVVAEIALAAGIPTPAVYVIPDSALNAFAVGRDTQHASIAVTEGLLAGMSREELQGVIGHELSHVRNLDIRFSLLVAALVGAVVLLSDIFLRSLRFGLGGKKSGKDSALLLILLLVVTIVLAILAPLFVKLIQLAVSRQREYLADASAVELTRNPIGLEHALAKIASDPDPRIERANRGTQHLYFSNPVSAEKINNWFSTHPPIADRIARLRSLSATS